MRRYWFFSMLGQIVLIAMLLLGSWVLVFETNGTSEAYVYCFFIAVIFGARFWGPRGGTMIGIVAGVATGPLMPLSVHPYASQSVSNWLVRLGVLVAVGLLVGHNFQRMTQKNREIEEQKKAQEDFSSEVIHALARTIALRDPYTKDHCRRVSQLSRAIGERMGLSDEELLYLSWSALIHDIGKIAIPESILNKPGALSPFEYGVVKEHPVLGDWVLGDLNAGERIRDGVVAHHERWDGTGYPYGYKGEMIPLQGRIIAVADVWDTVTSDRPYRRRLPRDECLAIMRDGRGTQFDPAVLDAFLAILSDKSVTELDIPLSEVSYGMTTMQTTTMKDIASFLDYRGHPQDSPFVWCIHCKHLCSTHGNAYTMRTAYHPTETGIYPCGICDAHGERKTRTSSS